MNPSFPRDASSKTDDRLRNGSGGIVAQIQPGILQSTALSGRCDGPPQGGRLQGGLVRRHRELIDCDSAGHDSGVHRIQDDELCLIKPSLVKCRCFPETRSRKSKVGGARGEATETVGRNSAGHDEWNAQEGE